MTSTRTVKLGVAQMLVEGGAVSANLARAERMIGAAALQRCSVIVLPECLDVGWTHPDAATLAAPIPGPRAAQLGRAAAEWRIVVVAGLTERQGTSVYNSAVLVGRDGTLLSVHRKINVLDIAQHLYCIGDSLHVARTDVGLMGVNICADNFPNALDIGRTIGRLGAHMLLSPSAWAVQADHDNRAEPYGALWRDAYGQLAREFQMPVVGASNVGLITAGPWAGRKCIGCSLIVDSDGQTVATGPYDAESLVVAEVTVHDDRPRGTLISGTL